VTQKKKKKKKKKPSSSINKWANELNRQFSIEEIQMANKYMKKFKIFSQQRNTNQNVH
jgi:hypothetical protein